MPGFAELDRLTPTQDNLALENERLRKMLQLHAGDVMSLTNELDEWRYRALAAEEALAALSNGERASD